MTQKNKIFSIILSLLVLSSVACRKSGGGNGGGVVTEPGTFSITEASGNVKALIVKPNTTVSDIKIAFSSSADYTANFTVEDSETVEANKITLEDFEFANNSLTAKTTLVDKVRKLDSSSQTVDKTIKINFTFKAKDTTLKNNTKTLSIEVKLTKELAFKLSSLVGTWKDANNYKFDISDVGKISGISIKNVSGQDIQIADWDLNKDKEVTKHTETLTGQKSGNYSYDFLFTFTSGSNCIVTLTEQGEGKTPELFNLTKDTTTK